VLAVLLCREGLPGLLKRCFSLQPSSESNHGLALEHPLSGGESPPITIVVIIEVWRRAGKRTKITQDTVLYILVGVLQLP